MSWDFDLGVVALPSDAKAALNRLASDGASLNTSIVNCTSLDAASKSEWASFYSYLQTFTAQTPVWFFQTSPTDVLTTGYLSEQIVQNQRTLLAWQQKVSAQCAPPPVLDPGAGNASLARALSGSGTTIQWVAAAVAVVGAAYLGGQLVTLVPSARMRARASRERERTTRIALRR